MARLKPADCRETSCTGLLLESESELNQISGCYFHASQAVVFIRPAAKQTLTQKMELAFSQKLCSNPPLKITNITDNTTLSALKSSWCVHGQICSFVVVLHLMLPLFDVDSSFPVVCSKHSEDVHLRSPVICHHVF